MKSRSHRLPTYDPPDDWVNGSWTVDCVCGVNFDDGEEMVNCDECGVWVHTRCSRFVKGDKSFACDKCKSKSNRNDTEETEVAQLLVELPTKTIKMNRDTNKNNNGSYALNKNLPPTCRPCGLWAERPMGERVHVQGIPGGDPSLFQGLSSIFTAQLWKCSGYVPKKFNFHYREFPCWDGEKKVDEKVAEDGDNMADKGAGVLYSLSKETVVGGPVAAPAGMRNQAEADFCPGMDEKSSMVRKLDGGDANSRGVLGTEKEERSLLRSILIQSGKRKREDVGASREKSVKKKNKPMDVKTNKAHALRTAVQPPHFSVGIHVKYHEGKGPGVQNDEVKHGKDRNTASPEVASDINQATGSNSDNPKSRAATTESILEPLSPKMSGHDHLANNGVKADKDENSCSMKVDKYTFTDVSPSLLAVQDDAGSIPAVKEVMDLNNLKNELQDCAASPVNDLQKSNSPAGDEGSAAAEIKDGDISMKAGTDVCTDSVVPNIKSAADTTDDCKKGIVKSFSGCIGEIMENTNAFAQSQVLPDDHISGNSKVNDAAACSSHFGDPKAHNANKVLEAVSDCCVDKKPVDASETVSQLKQDLKVSSEHDLEPKIISLESKPVCKDAEERLKFNAAASKPPAFDGQRRIVPAGKSCSSSTNIVISRSSSSADKFTNANFQPHKQMIEQALSNSVVYTKKDRVTSDLVKKEDAKNEDKHGVILKQHSKPFVNYPVPNESHSGRMLDVSISKHTFVGAKDAGRSKAPSVECSATTSAAGKSTGGSLQNQKGISHGRSKNISSTLQTSAEKSIQPSSKANHSSSGNPVASSNPPAGLSDEELALLLHQELNSSPRVPRIPRMRNAGSLAQLPSASVSSMLTKRTSSSGGKDHYTLLRRKGKDGHKDGSRSSREPEKEGRRVERVPSSPDSTKTADEELLCYSRKSSARIVMASSSSSADANERKLSSERNSPLNNCEGDPGTKGPANRTLPGLIAEIMSKGERMTYEELCTAVLPHWHNLRKHNGERYAYASHSQAVLDCLRNRVEWARLVERGPKTNANRKRRKIDAEPLNMESEDNGFGEEGVGGRGSKSVNTSSSREEFPKGKRNTRKHRRLALQGRGVRDLRKRRKAKVVSDDDDNDDDDETASSSSSPSEESAFSEDESNGVGPAGSEDFAATSDDRAAA